MTTEISHPERSGNVPPEHLNVGQVLVAENRGTCGGVKMAIETTRQVLDIVGGRELVYVNRAIVNNRPVMNSFGANLVNIDNDWTKIPNGSILLFSAHGVPPSFYEAAKAKNLLTIDTTCQLVKRVHRLAKKTESEGKFVLYVGKTGHPETEGVLGEIDPKNRGFIEPDADIQNLSLPIDRPTVVYSQTTLSTKEIQATMQALRNRFSEVEIPNHWDICPATDVRQQSITAMLGQIDALLVVGSDGSHNTEELRKLGEIKRIPSFRIDEPSEIKPSWFGVGVASLGITSGASVPEEYLEAVLDRFIKQRTPVVYLRQGRKEKPEMFRLPQKDIDALRLRYAA